MVSATPVWAQNSAGTNSVSCPPKIPVISWIWKPKAECQNAPSLFQWSQTQLQQLVSAPPESPVSAPVTPTPTPQPLPIIDFNPRSISSNSLPTQIIETLTAGSGISIVNRVISNTGILSLLAGDGIKLDGTTVINNDKGSAQQFFKSIHVSGQESILAGVNNDNFTFVAGSGISLSTDATNKKMTITNTVPVGSGSDDWTGDGSIISLADGSDVVTLGSSASLGKLGLVGTSDQTQLVIRGFSSQTNSLLDLQNSSGTSLASFSSAGVLSLPSNGLSVGTNQLVVTNGRVGIGTASPGSALDVNGNVRVATNSGITLFSNNSAGSVSRLLTLRATTKYDRPWISNVDYTGRHVVTFGHLDTNHDDIVHKRFELKTVGALGGPDEETLLTRLAIDYDRDLADVIFGQIDTIGVHNNYGDRIKEVHQMRDAADTGSYVIGQWVTELGSADTSIVTIEPKTLTSTNAATLRFFRETNTSGQKRFVIHKGDGTSTESFAINAGTGVVSIEGNAGGLLMGDGTNTSSYINYQSNRTLVGYDGSNAAIQGGINKGIKFNVNASSFGQGTVMSISSTGTVTINNLATAGGVVYTDSTGLLSSIAGTSGQCLISNGTSAPSWGSCGSGGTTPWTTSNGTILPLNQTQDLLLGGTASSAAKFAVLNINNGTPTASVSSGVSGNAAYLSADGTLATANNRSLAINPSGGRVGIGTSSPTAALHVSANSGSLAVGDGTNTTSYTNYQASRTMMGYDGSFAVVQGGTSKGVKFNVNNSSFGQGTAMTITTTGDVGIGTTPTLGPLQMLSGAHVTSGGDWTNASDRNLKANFVNLDHEEILAKIAALPLTQWNYKNQSSSVKHIGPMAQDFYAAFGLGGTDTAISTIDTAGVALVGIQGLQQKVARLESQNSLAKTTPLPEIDLDQLDSLTITDKLEAKNQLSVVGEAFLKGKTWFDGAATFLANVVFKGRVRFEKAPEFGADTAGLAMIKAGADKVVINFEEKYPQLPQVTAAISAQGNESEIFDRQLQFVVNKVTEQGFEITLNQPAPFDVSFAWHAIAVDNPKTFVGAEPAMAKETSANPSPSSTPTSSPSPTPTPVASPTASASATSN